jgi:hypothetical protein
MLEVVQEEQIDREWSWAYFDGAASGDQLLCGGGVVYTYPLHHFFFSRLGWELVQTISLRLWH